MISICIPIFNFDVSALITALKLQMEQTQMGCELLLIDDGSTEDFKLLNRSYIADCQYVELEKNVGRAKIRNLFLSYATQPYLLFLDCDAIIDSPNFLQNYLDQLPLQPNIICGGRLYPKEKPDKNRMLRWNYGVQCESQPSAIRALHPNKSFMTNNFLIEKELFASVPFEERLTQYGHEDTLFGYELSKKNINILHIENPVINGDIETNEDFLKKTEAGIQNLIQILIFTNYDPKIINSIRLLKTYQRVKILKPILKPIFSLINPILRNKLIKKGNSVMLFNLYKLGLLFCN
jgi:glycosyltransferase involved in cell wall biosynthesis